MRLKQLLRLSAVGAVFALFAISAHAAMIKKMDLAEMVQNADKVFRGTVMNKEAGSVEAGGGTLPTIVYTVRVDDALQGNFGEGKAAQVVQITMIGNLKAQPATGNLQRLNTFNLNPDLAVGSTYVLFTTAPSAVGLSTTVGLTQGLFRVFNDAAGREMTANGVDNAGIFDGPVSYATLKSAIDAAAQ